MTYNSFLALSPFSILRNYLIMCCWTGDKMSRTGKNIDQEWPRIDKTPSGLVPVMWTLPRESPKMNSPLLTLLSHHKLVKCRLPRRDLTCWAILEPVAKVTVHLIYPYQNIPHSLNQVEKVNKSSTVQTTMICKALHCPICLFTIVNPHSSNPESGADWKRLFPLPNNAGS